MIDYLKSNKAHALEIYGHEPKTFDELAECVIAVANTHKNRTISRRGVLTESEAAKVVGLSWNIQYSPQVSTSHSSPMVGKNDKDYAPGMLGRVWIRYASDYGYSFGSDPLRRTLTYTGTGGIGGYSGPFEPIMNARYKRYGHFNKSEHKFPPVMAYSWDYRIYLSDWPLLEEFIGAQETWCILKNKQFSFKHEFLWQDPDTLAADTAFMKAEFA